MVVGEQRVLRIRGVATCSTNRSGVSEKTVAEKSRQVNRHLLDALMPTAYFDLVYRYSRTCDLVVCSDQYS